MNEDLDLVKLLKDVPKGTKFYCLMFGYVALDGISKDMSHPISFKMDNGSCESVTSEGKWHKYHPNGECVFFPSKEQRDWDVWKKEQEEAKKRLLPIDTPVMCSILKDDFILRYYNKENECFYGGGTSKTTKCSTKWGIIIPFDKFDPNNIEESLKHNIVK